MRWCAAAVLAIASAGCDLVFAPAKLDQDASLDAAPPMCPLATYLPIPNAPSLYRIVTSPTLPWREAEGACEADGHDSTHLVVFDDITEVLAVRQEMEPIGGFLAYAGYARDPGDPPDRFRAVTGEALSPSSNLWEPGEPTGGNEQTIHFTNVEDLLDGSHTVPLAYVCECDGRPVTESFTLP